MSDPQPTELISEADIQKRVSELAEEISADYADAGEVVLIGVLKMFAATSRVAMS